MTKQSGRWKPGESGNPKGRPPKGRALTDILEKTGSKMVDVVHPDGSVKRVSGKRLLGAMVWEAATTGQVTMPDGTIKQIEDFNDWLTVAQFIYKHIDGPPPKPVELSGVDGNPIDVSISWRAVVEAAKQELEDDDSE